MKAKTFYIISLGCAKNTVDSDTMAQLLRREGYTPADAPQEAEVVIVNTCGFIDSAREESYRVLGEIAEGAGDQVLIAAGCLAQRSGPEIVRQIPRIDGVIGTRRWMDIGEVVASLRGGEGHPRALYHIPGVDAAGQDAVGQDTRGTRGVHVQGGSAYLKIGDGCRRPCAFCAIPLIKGLAISRPLEDILQDAVLLQESGVREINLIAQDTTDYGHDLGMKDGLAQLLERMAEAVPNVDWIRILYAYPGYVTDRLIETMAAHDSIIPYLDMPLQHAHPGVLRRMRRPANVEWVHDTVAKLRQTMPNLALRTTFIVGYPGETEEEFQTLLDFVEEIRFDRVGVFEFSFEIGVPAEPLGDPVPAEVKVERKERLMLAQQDISLAKNRSLVGKALDVLVEGQGLIEGSNDAISLGRSYRDAPEIDGMVIVEGNLPVGEIVPVKITGAMVYDLMGVETSV